MALQRRKVATEELGELPVNPRVKIAALWTSMMFVFAYIDILSFFRPDVRADIEAGQVFVFEIGEAFLLGVTIYILIPSLMVFGALVLRPRIARVANISVAAVYALTIVGAAVGEWGYYVLGSVAEVALLAGIVYYSLTWPRQASAVRHEDQPERVQLVG